MSLIAKGTNILLSNGTVKNIEDITDKEFIVDINGNISNINVKKTNGKLFKYYMNNGLDIVGNINFLTLNKNNCRHPLQDLKNAKIINDYVDKGYFLINRNLKQESNFILPKEVIFLLGMFTSNGRYLEKNGKIFGCSIFSYNKEKVKKILKKYFPCASVRENKDLILFSGKEIVNFFLRNSFGNQKNRKVSMEIFWMKKDLQLEFLKGWFYNKGNEMNSNCLIGCFRSKNIMSLLCFMLARNGIPYTITKNINFRLIITGTEANKINKNFKEIDDKRFQYRNFNGNILFRVKKIEEIGICEAFDIGDSGLIANNYAIGKENKNINNVFKCLCNKDLILFENELCSKCQLKEIKKISWRKELKCKRCNKIIESKKGTRKFCSDVCRRLFYNPLEEQNFASNYNGYVNKGYISYPQKFIYDLVIKKYNKYSWTYNDRTIIRNPNTNYPLELDIWCEKLKFAIEFDGLQHFEGERDLKYTKKLDIVKNKECKKLGIKLLRINYKHNWKNEDWLIKKIGEFINDDN